MSNSTDLNDPNKQGIILLNGSSLSPSKIAGKSAECWKVADVLRGTFKPAEYIKAMLPFIVLRRLDSVYETRGTKQDVITTYENSKDDLEAEDLEVLLQNKAGLSYYSYSAYSFAGLLVDPHNLEENLLRYIQSYSANVVSIMSNFEFKETISKLAKFNLLYGIVEQFAQMDLSIYEKGINENGLTNIEMGYVFEDLLRRFSEMTNETAGEHYTPRSIVKLCAELAIGLDEMLTGTEVFCTVYDPTCGTGGMLTVGEEVIKSRYPQLARVELYGQEMNPESFAIAQADLLIKGHGSEGIKLGDTLVNDQLKGKKFNYVLANPPYGVSWKHQEQQVKREREELGFEGRFGAGTPSVSDGSLLFVQHMVAKLNENGGRAAVVLNGSPLTNGDAGSGESEIRKWILDNDLLVAIVALPTDMFYNTGIKTYIWLLDADKEERRKDKVQFIDASSKFVKMKKPLGKKRRDMEEEHIAWVKDMYALFDNADKKTSIVLDKEDLFYTKVTIDQPLRKVWVITNEVIEDLREGEYKQIEALNDKDAFLDALYLLSNETHLVREDLIKKLKEVAQDTENKCPAPLSNLILKTAQTDNENAVIALDAKGKQLIDPAKKDFEKIPLSLDILNYLEEEVKPYVPDMIYDPKKNKIGVEFPFEKLFYTFQPLPSTEDIKELLIESRDRIESLMKDLY